jgi:hypothetical protein
MLKIKKIIIVALSTALALLPLSLERAWAAGISVSGGGNKVVGQSFAVTVKASGAEFDSLQGTISVSGPVSVSVSAGAATWLPGKAPSNGGQFVGIVSPTSNLTVATITLKGTKEGKGSVSVSGVNLARNGSYVGSSGGSTSFTIGRAPTPPGSIAVTSSTHPDQNTFYEATTATLSWSPPGNGASGYSTTFDEAAETVPGATISTKETTATYTDLKIGTHYFHIRAQNGDGWGPTTHFKINIKEPDAKVDPSLTAPVISALDKAGDFKTDLTKGTVSGVVISGSGALEGYSVNVSFEPKDRLPAELFIPVGSASSAPAAADPQAGSASSSASGESLATPTTGSGEAVGSASSPLTPLQTLPKSGGTWTLTLTHPIPSGFYTLTAQSQKDKVLSPVSSPVYVEFSVANGGSIRIITDKDLTVPTKSISVLGVNFSSPAHLWISVISILLLIGLVTTASIYLWRRYKSKVRL